MGEATVTLNTGSKSYTVTSASFPNSDRGHYEFANIPPGTYTLTVSIGTGTSTNSQVVPLPAGVASTKDVSLDLPASLTGTVKLVNSSGQVTGAPKRAWYVFLYTTANYPSIVSSVAKTDSGRQLHVPADRRG